MIVDKYRPVVRSEWVGDEKIIDEFSEYVINSIPVILSGPSGTGKTSLLRLIKWFISRDLRIGDDLKLAVPEGGQVSMDFIVGDLNFRLTNNGTDLEYTSFGIDEKNKRKSKGKLSFTIRGTLENPRFKLL